MKWRTLIEKTLTLESYYDNLKNRWLARRTPQKPLVVPYIGYGTPYKLYLKGRVLLGKTVSEPREDDPIWNNIVNLYRRFDSDELAHVPLQATFGGQSYPLQTNEEGYFDLTLTPNQPIINEQVWHEVALELFAPYQIKTVAEVIIPPSTAQFGVISDIDDTVIKTGSTNLLALAKNMLLRNAHTRPPFVGVAEFYQALQGAQEANPIFYVSSSPWNLYDLLLDIFEYQNIPVGPLFLQDFGFDRDKWLKKSHQQHKLQHIDHLMMVYPHLPFILIGDSGQKDAEIYCEVVKRYPQRVLAIYIRDVSRRKRDQTVMELAKTVQSLGVDLVLVPDTMAAQRHATEHGWITK